MTVVVLVKVNVCACFARGSSVDSAAGAVYQINLLIYTDSRPREEFKGHFQGQGQIRDQGQIWGKGQILVQGQIMVQGHPQGHCRGQGQCLYVWLYVPLASPEDCLLTAPMVPSTGLKH